jgi:hypothetical protein
VNDALHTYFEKAVQEEIQRLAAEHFAGMLEQAAEQEDLRNAEYLSREIAWLEKQKDIERNGDVLLIKIEHPDGPVIWKIPARDAEFVKGVLPVFARRVKGSKSERRYALYKSLNGVEVAVHRLYLNARYDEQVHAFDSDLTNFCDVTVRYQVERNFGLTAHQREIVAPQYAERTCRNLYLTNAPDNPSYQRAQNDFERDRVTLVKDISRTKPHPIQANADLCTKVGTPHGPQDAGKHIPEPRTGVERCPDLRPRQSIRYKEASAKLDDITAI